MGLRSTEGTTVLAGGRIATVPNTYEAPMCQETHYSYERIFLLFFRL